MSVEAKNYHPCEAPVHNEKCNGEGNTVDHFTPTCICKVWGWTKEEMNAPENLQYLSRECHDDKDKTTEARLTLARKQLKGAYISLKYYLTIEDPSFQTERPERIPNPTKKKRRKHNKNILRSRYKVSRKF